MQRLQTLGGCLVTRDGARVDALAGQRKALALLALLAAARERGVPRDTLLAQLWPESDEDRARASLKQLVHSLRTRLGSPEAIGGSLELRLDASAIAVDLWEFRDAIARGDHESAAALYGGPFLDGFFLRGADEFERWAAAERGVLAAELIRSVEVVADRAGATGDHAASVSAWRRLVAIEPLSARAAIGLMRALDAAGHRAAALQHASIHARLLEAELGSVPDSGVSALAARLRSEPAPTAGVAPIEVRASAVSLDSPGPPPVPVAPRRMVDAFRIAPPSIALAGLALAGAALLGWATLADRPGRRDLVVGRFVVAPLENLTGDRSLDRIGRVSADWLAQAIAESDSVDVVSPAAVAILLREASGSMAEQRDLLARATGAQRVLSGGFARRGRDSLVLQANVLDARDGHVIWKLDPAAAPVGDPTIAIQALREQLLGAVVSDARPRARVRGIRPPRYSAYLEYLAAAELYERHMDFLAARAYLERVVGLDSTFAAAWTMLLGTYVNRDEYAGAGEVLRRMERVRGSFSPTDLDYFEFARGHAHLDHAVMLPAVQRLAARDSNPVMLYLIGWSGVALLRPRDAVPALERADSLMVANGWRYQPATLGQAYHQAGAYDRELGSLERGRRLFPGEDGYPGWQLRAFAGLRRPAAAIALADTILLGITDTEGARANQLLAAAAEFRVHDDSVTARRLAEMAAGWYATHPPRRPSSNRGRREGRAAYLTGRHELAVRLLERAARDTNDLDAAGYLALTHVSRGERARARSMADSIGALRREWLFGRHTRWRGAILGALGERERAVELLRQASREGDDRTAWHSDPSLDQLRGFPAFEELIRPAR